MRTKIIEVNASTGYKDCNHSGHYAVLYDNAAKTNPYRVYSYWTEFSDHGITKHRTQLQRYGDFASAMYFLFQVTTNQISIGK